jgi:hypothetical protein
MELRPSVVHKTLQSTHKIPYVNISKCLNVDVESLHRTHDTVRMH